MSIEVEKYVKLYVRPRPNWLPDFAYRWLMARVVLYESLPSLRVGEAIPPTQEPHSRRSANANLSSSSSPSQDTETP